MLPLLLALSLSCGDAPVDSGVPAICEDAPALTWANWGDGFFATYCRSCHSETTPDRRGAPEGIDFNTREQVQAQAALVRDSVLVRGSMPVGGGVYEEDLEMLEVFLDCGL
ncbi:MAG: hypothetical protein H6740_14115 [Alphaproteobacteria bacterium]|nr:hypothetical protein [Alphaproteobacteria bacterium]